VSERSLLAAYVTLQRLLTQRLTLQREVETPPAELAALRTRDAEREAALAANRKRRGELEAEYGALERETGALYEEREHVRRQKSQVTNMKQLQAVVSALDHVQGQIDERESKLKRIMEELDSLDGQAATLTAESPEERLQRERLEEEWAQRRGGSEAELERVRGRLREVQVELGSAAMEGFKKLWNLRKPHAVVPIDGDSCSACHAVLRAALLQLVRGGETLQYCETCRRLLYDPAQFPPP
jgi:hypothetical protein